jgi:hypothetical protein
MFVSDKEWKGFSYAWHQVGSDDYGRDLTGVQNLKKKHKRLESELASHEPTIQVSSFQLFLKIILSRTLRNGKFDNYRCQVNLVEWP